MGIVRVEQVKHHFIDRIRIAHKNFVKLTGELFDAELSESIKIQTGFRKGIVHNRVELISAEINVGVVPVFAYQNAIRLYCLYRRPELPPERMRHFVRHVQPPAVYVVLFYPIGRNTDKILTDFGVGSVELGHILAGSKTLVFEGIIVCNYKPVVISRFSALLQNVLKFFQIFAAMVKHRIQHDFYTHRMGFFYKFLQIGFTAEIFVYLVIIAYVVLMVRHGTKYGSKVQGVYPQPVQISQFSGYALYIPARKTFGVGDIPPFEIDVRFVFACAAHIESFDENLIKRRRIHPADGFYYIAFIYVSILKTVIITQFEIEFFGQPVLRVKIHVFAAGNFKHVHQPQIIQL